MSRPWMKMSFNMDRLPLLDLQEQHRPIADGLMAAASRVISSGRFISASEVAAFERELAAVLHVGNVVGVSSGTDALLALLMAAGVGPGDEVVTTPYSFFATVEAIVRLGARPVFCDVDPDTANLDPAAAISRIGAATKAVLVVHLFGRPAPLATLKAACDQRGIALIEDAAQAIGASGVGTGRGAALSFFPAKNLGGFGDGGAVLTNDSNLAETVRSLRNHGASERFCHLRVGGNFRLDELQAALLRVKLPLLEQWTAQRRQVARLYGEALQHLPIVLPLADDSSVWNSYVVRVKAEQRAALIQQLADGGIASAVYYPIPLHLQPALAWLGHRPGDFPRAEQAAREALALPIFPGMTSTQVDAVRRAIASFLT